MEHLIRPHIRSLPAYQPVQPLAVRAAQLGLPAERLAKLDANENPYGPLPAAREALAALTDAHIYPDPENRRLRTRLAAWLNVPVENILAGAGADDLIDLLLRLFLDPGDAVLTCPPTFSMYAFDARLHRGRVIRVPRRPDFSPDLSAIRRAVQQHSPKLLFLAAPNNPDGSLPPEDDLRALLELPLVLVLDEAYVEFAPPGSSRVPWVPQRNNLIVLRTFSKWGGLAGLRAGYGIFPSPLMPHLWKIKQPYSLSAAAEAAACATLDHREELEVRTARILQERRRLFEALQAIPWLQPCPSQANFILCRVQGRSAAALQAALARRGVLVRYFDKPGLRDHIRISVGRPEHSAALLAALKSLA